MVSSSDALAHSGGGLPKRLILAVALASVVGTIGGAVVLKFLDDAQGSIVPEPQPPPPPPPPVVPAVVVTELHLSGVPTFLALKSVRDHLPPHSLRHYQKGRAELVFQGEISGALADQLTNLNIALDEGKHWHVEVSEIVGGTLTAELLEGAPTPDEPAPVLPDLLPDAGTLLAPDGLEP